MKGVTVISMILTNILSLATITPAMGPADTMGFPVVSAHRGGMTLYPENTLTAFKAVRDNHPEQPIEFDVRALSDGTLVIVHDATVDRTAAGGATGNVKDMTRAQWGSLRIVDPTGGAAPATTLDEVIAEFGGTDTVLVPELKDNDAADKFIEKLWPYRGQIVVQSSSTAIVSRLVRSGFKTLQLSSTPITPVKGVYAVGMRHDAITQTVVDDAHTQGITVWAWTVNDQPRINTLTGMGVDAIITNDPRLVIPS